MALYCSVFGRKLLSGVVLPQISFLRTLVQRLMAYLLGGGKALQRDLYRLAQWAISNCVTFNKGKCRVLHLCYNNLMQWYKLEEEGWKVFPAEKDLGWWLTAG